MQMNTREADLTLISVKRNPYLKAYENERERNARLDRARTQRRRRSAHRRQVLQIKCMAVAFGMIALAVLGISLLIKNSRATAAGNSQSGGISDAAAGGGQNVGAGTIEAAGAGSAGGQQGAAGTNPAGTAVQGISAEKFAAHPEWKEDFLTPNEYSRPGDELKEVKNIFVHYTANPGTSAAQNRSYFERQKDEHLASVSSHFIIGYEGEIIQCVPLDEIAYAVQTRNFDSVSIECCYKAKDGSFTKETYNSLISLLAWLTDVYDLDTEDILRHYDCGGKKCPIYYTNHKDKWEQLKEDVGKARENP